MSIKPQFNLIVLDDTKSWNEEIVKKAGGKIYGVYLYDESRITFYCEIKPSYNLYLLYSYPENYPENQEQIEDLDRLMYETDSNDELTIQHCSVINGLIKNPEFSKKYFRKIDCSEIKESEFEDDEEYNELLEKYMDEYRSNRYFG